MAYGLDLSRLEEEELDIAGYPKYPIKDFGGFGTRHTTFNPYVTPGTVEDVGSGALIPLRGAPSNLEKQATRYAADIAEIESRIPSNKTSTRRGLDFDFTTKMPDLPTAPTSAKPSTVTKAIPSTEEFVQGITKPNKPSSFTDWWGKMEPDRKQALTRGLLATGLNMMALGGRTYDRPVSALGIIGEAGKAGLSQYEDTYDREQAHKLRKEYLDVAKEGLKLKSDVYKAKMASMSTTDKTLFKDAQSEQAAMIRQFSPMLGDSLAALDPANFLSEINNNPTVREIVEKNIKKTPAGLEKWDRLDGIINQRFGIKPSRGLNLSPETKTLDEETAKEFLNQAGGDKEKARELARQSGYNF